MSRTVVLSCTLLCSKLIVLSSKTCMSVDEYYSAFGRLMGSLTSMVPDCTAEDCPAHKFIEKFIIVLSWV